MKTDTAATAASASPATLPAECLAFLPANPPGHRIVVIRRGQKGHTQSRYDHAGLSEATARQIVADINRHLGVTATQRVAMLAGCLHDWLPTLVDPRAYAEAAAEDLLQILAAAGGRLH